MSGRRSRRLSAKKRLYLIGMAVILVFALVIEIGSRIPGSGIPDWDTLFADSGFQGTSTTPGGQLEVHFIDVGNADCILVRQGAASMLIDAGEKGDADTILEYLQRQGVERLNIVIATHPHADHIGSMARVIRALPIDTFLMAYMPQSATPTSAVYLSMLQALDEKQVSVRQAQPGDTLSLGEAQVQILAPLEQSSDPNNMSVVSRVVYGERRFLFMGDAETPVEQALLERGTELSADVLKAGHHGSRTATSEAFLKRVAPAYAVLTCGKGNSYGHPHKETLQLLEKHNVTTLRSDVDGDIVFVTDGHTAVQLQKEAA